MLDDRVFICVDVSHVNNEQIHRIDKPLLEHITAYVEKYAPRIHEIMKIDSSEFDLKIVMYSMISAYYKRKPDRKPYIALCIDELRGLQHKYPFSAYYEAAGVKTLEHRVLFAYIHELQHHKQIEITGQFHHSEPGLVIWDFEGYRILTSVGITYGLRMSDNVPVDYYNLPWEVDANNTAINVFRQLNIT